MARGRDGDYRRRTVVHVGSVQTRASVSSAHIALVGSTNGKRRTIGGALERAADTRRDSEYNDARPSARPRRPRSMSHVEAQNPIKRYTQSRSEYNIKSRRDSRLLPLPMNNDAQMYPASGGAGAGGTPSEARSQPTKSQFR
ncbi:hypothetical protein EVAR_100808_1 [Eumeta japonica]|uniref:Uncharacterized protein n=1 Tax=Eumeta variegata TaxID=151549 RepID=A0A4C1SKE8_EUMVA|nr:hypothetical protein EVAR_100808_1 [Eumeta japonica]